MSEQRARQYRDARDGGSIDTLLIVAPSAYPLGGVATWLDYLLPGLADRGWRPVLGLTSGEFHDVGRYRAVHAWSDCLTVANPSGTREGRVRALVDAIRDVRPELIATVNIPDTYAAVQRMRASDETAPRVVMTNHSLEEHYFADAEAWEGVLDGLICTNRLGSRLAMERGKFDSGRVHYAPYGVDVPVRIERDAGGSGVLRIAYSGRLDRLQKRADDIPAILASLGRLGVEHELKIAGGGPCEEELKARLGQENRAGRTTFLGILDAGSLVDSVYAKADVLLVTSLWETGPIVIWEAMASGLPVVTSRYIGSGFEGSLKDGENCMMYEIGDADGAARQLQRALDPQLRGSLAAAGRALVRERYSTAASVEAWDACFRRVLKAPIRPAVAHVLPTAPGGRLDRIFGTRPAESIRRMLGRRYRHGDPGGEWPHTHSESVAGVDAYWTDAARLDSIPMKA